MDKKIVEIIELEGKTFSEVAGIRNEGDNKWVALIQNAGKKKIIST